MTKYSAKSASSFKFKSIRYHKGNWRATITINRPEVHNALNFNTLRELDIALNDASWDDEVAVIILTGAGTKAFCTGADMKEWNEDFRDHPSDFYKWMGVFIQTFERLRNIGKPTIARINGMAVGGGNELQMSCDLAIAAEDTFIKHVGVARGSVPAAGATQWLPLIVGDRRAREILLLCESIPANQALEWGLINRVVPRKKLDQAVNEMADKLIDKLPECTRYAKQQLNFWRDLSWGLTIGHAKDWLTVHTDSAEVHEGVQAFVEKREIDYQKLRRDQTSGRAGSPSKRQRRSK
ncbi:MAG: enoyl-CoA hydratase/isomerase family protein [Ignavibacteria bacterium]|nr:enoyl-CoA hydratase/isomerase family protein [Ignavibacteria bacterium]